MRLQLSVAVLFATLTGCKEVNPRFCEDPENAAATGCSHAGSAGDHCKGTGDCVATPNTPVCDTTSNDGTCVQCTADDPGVCAGTTPLCVSDACTGCTKHTDCKESNTCMPDGSCAPSSEVAYVDGTMGVDKAPCTKALPCTRIEDGVAAKPIVKVTGTVANRCSLNNQTAKILAEPGTKLAPASTDNGVVLEIKGTSNIEIYDLQISNSNGANSPGITAADTATVTLTRAVIRDNAGSGVSISGGQLTCTSCTIANNSRGIDASAGTTTVMQSTIRDNASGGIRIMGPAAFHIVSNFILRNGQAGKAGSSGVLISVDMQSVGAPLNQIDFNSISKNLTVDMGQGIQCIAGTPLDVNNNIIWDNGVSPATAMQVSGNGCNYRFSDVGPVDIGSANSNLSFSPMFQDESSGNLHLTKDSMLRGKSDPGLAPSGLTARDIDGDVRPTTMPSDIGADQFREP